MTSGPGDETARFALLDETSRARLLRSAPTGGAIDMSLSFKMTISRLPAASALFIAS